MKNPSFCCLLTAVFMFQVVVVCLNQLSFPIKKKTYFAILFMFRCSFRVTYNGGVIPVSVYSADC